MYIYMLGTKSSFLNHGLLKRPGGLSLWATFNQNYGLLGGVAACCFQLLDLQVTPKLQKPWR